MIIQHSTRGGRPIIMKVITSAGRHAGGARRGGLCEPPLSAVPPITIARVHGNELGAVCGRLAPMQQPG